MTILHVRNSQDRNTGLKDQQRKLRKQYFNGSETLK